MTDMEDAELERHFAAARSRAPAPSADFMARALADAEALQPVAAPQHRKGSMPGWMPALRDWFDRAAMPGGLVAATLVGVLIGLSSGDVITQQAVALMETDLGMELAYRFPAIGGFLEEI